MRFTIFSNKGGMEKSTDAVLRVLDDDACVFVVVDGGEFCGDIAAPIIMEAIQNEFKGGIKVNDAFIKKCVRAAIEKLKEKTAESDGFKKVKASCAMLVTDGKKAIWGHIGNCRIYRLKSGKIKELTNDHTTAWKSFENKEISFGDVSKKDKWPPLVSISYDNDIEPDVSKVKNLFYEYSFILCTDGFWKNISGDEIEKCAKSHGNTKVCLCKMIDYVESNCDSDCDSVSAIMVNL